MVKVKPGESIQVKLQTVILQQKSPKQSVKGYNYASFSKIFIVLCYSPFQFPQPGRQILLF